MVMAALAVTTEYRFGTIRATFLAVPDAAVLLGKTAVLALLAGSSAMVVFGAWGIGSLFGPSADMSINSGAEWRVAGGTGPGLRLAAVMAVAVGILSGRRRAPRRS